LQPLEIPQNRQSFLWKSLEENKRDLERLAKKLWRAAIIPPASAPSAWKLA
jgi:hypothetical protein